MIRFTHSVTLKRPTIDSFGDRVLPSGSTVSGAVWPRRRKAVVGGQGEFAEVTAIGFLPSGTDVQYRDQLVLAAGPQAGATFEVLTVVSSFDDRARVDHVGVELREVS